MRGSNLSARALLLRHLSLCAGRGKRSCSWQAQPTPPAAALATASCAMSGTRCAQLPATHPQHIYFIDINVKQLVSIHGWLLVA
jgi:hypothetical protein